MLSEAEKHFFESHKGFTPRKNATRETAFDRLANQRGWVRGSREYDKQMTALKRAMSIAKPKVKAVACPARPVAETKFSKSFKGFDPRKNDTTESAFARLAERNGWPKGSTQYNNQLQALHKAAVPMRIPITTSPAPTNAMVNSVNPVKGSKPQSSAPKDHASTRLAKCRGWEAGTPAHKDPLSASRSISVGSHNQCETSVSRIVNTVVTDLSDPTASADDYERQRLAQRKDRENKFNNLKKLSANFHLKTAPLQDILWIVARDEEKQELQQKAQQELEAARTAKAAPAPKATEAPPLPVRPERQATRAWRGFQKAQNPQVAKDRASNPDGITDEDDTDESPYKLGQVSFASYAKDNQEHDDSCNAIPAKEAQKIPWTRNFKLDILQSLCRSISIDPAPDTVSECKQAFEGGFVNILLFEIQA